MMHDALRADVFASLLATTPEARQSIGKDLAEHTAIVNRSFEENLKLALPASRRSSIERIKPGLDSYVHTAADLIATAAGNRDAARAKLPAYIAKFEELKVSKLFGISLRASRNLLSAWVAGGFVEVADPARKTRRYGLNAEFAALIK